ncbi:neurotensin/neuromedin N [Pungitius pungitius]|uniref:neurotensin/neuromedin N n=1 Tax=Pungitius pungitius TaxID=134920 RepID=UPI001888B21A|nr:neurotensin/neuromedin N [Pungitius pungitius]
MQAQLACMLLLCFTCGGLCTDVDRDPQALEEELLRSLFPSKAKQNRQSAPYWRVSLVDLCRMVSGLRGEPWSGEEDEDEEEGELMDGSLHLREELYDLQVLCRALQSWEERILRGPQDYLQRSRDAPLKRKSPYILKRQAAHTTKSRRPYILKRSAT